MEGAASCPTHPVTRMDVTATTSTAGPIPPEVVELAENLFILDVAADVAPQRRLTHTAGEAANMPAEVVHLEQVAVHDVQIGRAHV